MSRLTRDGITEPISRDESFRRERGQGHINFPCPVDDEQDQYSCYMYEFTMCDVELAMRHMHHVSL